jgi:DNA polymerase III subunit gamma/tau
MHQALHLKYRPQTLAQLVGQDLISQTLSNAITTQQIAPAYLFTGLRGTGKTSTARILAKSLNCLQTDHPTITPCGECASCRAIEKSIALDVREIDAASHNGVDDARELIEHSSFAPTQGRYRIFILDEAHMLTTASQNALLKVIEEPPARVVFMLCTTEAHKVLPTIASRCQSFNFKTISLNSIVDHLRTIAQQEQIDITETGLTILGRTVAGSLRDALQLLSQLRLLEQTITPDLILEVSGGIPPETIVQLLTDISQGDTLNTLKTARTLIDSGKAPQLILSSLLAVYRDLLLVKTTPKCQHLISSSVNYSQLRSLVAHWQWIAIDQALNQLQKSENQLKTTLNAATWLEVCLLNLMPDSKTPNSPSQPSPDLSQIWADIVEKAKPNQQKLLNHAILKQFSSETAVLAVVPQYLSKFQTHSQTIERIIQKTLGTSVTVTIEEQK